MQLMYWAFCGLIAPVAGTRFLIIAMMMLEVVGWNVRERCGARVAGRKRTLPSPPSGSYTLARQVDKPDLTVQPPSRGSVTGSSERTRVAAC